MIIFAGIVLGAFWGARVARKRKGNRLDIAQYAAGFGILGAIIGVFLSVAVDRLV